MNLEILVTCSNLHCPTLCLLPNPALLIIPQLLGAVLQGLATLLHSSQGLGDTPWSPKFQFQSKVKVLSIFLHAPVAAPCYGSQMSTA